MKATSKHPTPVLTQQGGSDCLDGPTHVGFHTHEGRVEATHNYRSSVASHGLIDTDFDDAPGTLDIVASMLNERGML